VSLEQNISTDDLTIRASTIQIQQVTLNLLKNAYDAVKGKAEAKVTLSLEAYEMGEQFCKQNNFSRPGLYAHIAISDNGSGIRKDNIKHIFEPFFTTKEAENGTGLGLPMSKQIVESFHGLITVESKQSEGTTMHIYLPLASKQKEQTQDKTISLQDISLGKDETILVVESNDWLRNSYVDILKSHSYQPLAAKSARQALNLISDPLRSIDLVVTDIELERVDGGEVVQEILSIKPNVKFVFISNYSDDEKITQLKALPNFPLLRKPFHAEALLRSVKASLDG